ILHSSFFILNSQFFILHSPISPIANLEKNYMDIIFDTAQIQDTLPHRYPFLLVDRIIELDPGKRVVGLKNVTINEPFFQGHFPGLPVMPGVLIIEAMAQTGGMLMLGSVNDPQSKILLFTGIDEAKFRRPVVPGDTLRIEMTLLRFKGKVCKLQGRVFVEDKLAAEAEITSVLVDRSTLRKQSPVSAKETETPA
ncbi:MAG TPA: 3-hydroxyacyl-ACP dehydratase FabZ, partial [Acidobacteriota bacterium]|nr:3-hydroxyacyl-ACP dehydratase FabZ [Acidobacteriota bacterium]